MKRVSVLMVVMVSMIAIMFTAALAQETSLTPAKIFPHEIAAENYVPSLYFSAAQMGDEPLVVAPEFPYVTCDLCYSPSLYYEAWKIAAVQAVK